MTKDEKYISLKEAEEHCPYSADYLKLRARQGKLKAAKIGRIWVTTKEWVKEYQEEMVSYKEKRVQKKKVKKASFIVRPSLKLEFKARPLLLGATLLVLMIFLVILGTALEKTPDIAQAKKGLSVLYQRTIETFEKADQITEALIECAGDGASGVKKTVQKEIKESSQDLSFGLLAFKEYITQKQREFFIIVKNAGQYFQGLAAISTQEASQLILDSARKNISDVSESFKFSLSYEVDKIEVGSPQRPQGITVYDIETGEPYCLQIENGQIINLPGKCNY